jgi:flagellar protein FlbD
MIDVKKLDGEKLIINSDNIIFVEQKPDTLITFKDGQTLYVKDSMDDIKDKVMTYKRTLLDNEY